MDSYKKKLIFSFPHLCFPLTFFRDILFQVLFLINPQLAYKRYRTMAEEEEQEQLNPESILGVYTGERNSQDGLII